MTVNTGKIGLEDLKMKKGIKSDLHIHSNYSDGKFSIEQIVDYYGQRNYGAIAITDHLCERTNLIGKLSHQLKYSLSGETFEQYMEEISIQSVRALEQYNMLLIPGFEITKNSFANHRSAHMLILGVTQFIDPELSVEQILQTAKSAGAFTIAAHPFPTGELEFQTFYLWSQRNELKKYIDAWEMNSRKTISQEVLNSGLPLIANSDFHHQKHFHSWKTKVYSELNQDELFDSIKKQEIDFFIEV